MCACGGGEGGGVNEWQLTGYISVFSKFQTVFCLCVKTSLPSKEFIIHSRKICSTNRLIMCNSNSVSHGRLTYIQTRFETERQGNSEIT